MRRWSAFVVVGLLAAGCSQSESSSPDSVAPEPTAKVADAVTTVAVATTAAPAVVDVPTTEPVAPEETAPAEPVGVTVGDDGRLQPAPCAAGTNTEDPQLGVTADTVNVALVSIDFAPLAKIGFANSDRDVTAAAQPYIDAINEAGGICGRKLDYQGVLYDILGAKGGEACLQVTEDRRNAIVLGQGGFNEITCVVEAGTLAVSQQDWSRQDVEEAGDLFFVRGVPLDDQFTTTIQYALDNNLLQGKKVGVWYGGLFPNQNDTFEKVGLPLLETSGVEFKAFRTDFTGPSDPQGSTVLKTAAAEFASMGIDVLLNFTGATNHPGMKNELNALGVKPQYISAPVSGNSSIELFAKSFNTAEISNGEIYTTYAMPVGQVDASMPGAASCMEQYTAATGETVEPATFDYSVIINVCTQIDMVAAILSLAGPELTQAGMVAAIEALPAYANARSLGEVYYGPGGRFDIHAMGILQYDGTTNKTSFDGELLPIDE